MRAHGAGLGCQLAKVAVMSWGAAMYGLRVRPELRGTGAPNMSAARTPPPLSARAGAYHEAGRSADLLAYAFERTGGDPGGQNVTRRRQCGGAVLGVRLWSRLGNEHFRSIADLAHHATEVEHAEALARGRRRRLAAPGLHMTRCDGAAALFANAGLAVERTLADEACRFWRTHFGTAQCVVGRVKGGAAGRLRGSN